jgi:hypothetical protein
MNRSEALNKQYEIIRYLCYQLIHYQSDFKNEFAVQSAEDKHIYESISELYKTLQDDAFASADLIYETLNNDDALGKGVQ